LPVLGTMLSQEAFLVAFHDIGCPPELLIQRICGLELEQLATPVKVRLAGLVTMCAGALAVIVVKLQTGPVVLPPQPFLAMIFQ